MPLTDSPAFSLQTIVRGSRPPKDASINGLLEEFDSISVTRSNSLRKESPPGAHQAGGSKPASASTSNAGGPEENGFGHYYGRFSCDLDSSKDFSLEAYRERGVPDAEYYGRHYRFSLRHNGHPIRSPFYPDAMPQKSSDYAKMPPDYHAYLESRCGCPPPRWPWCWPQGIPNPASLADPARITGSIHWEQPSRVSIHSEQMNYPDGDWGYGRRE